MTPKYKKILGNVVIGAALFWILGFFADILIPLLVRRFGDPSTFYGYEGVGITIASCVSLNIFQFSFGLATDCLSL